MTRRGITGIGILILFVALVLVAAIASGVILDTAGFLQNKAADTGQDATAQVSDRLRVISVTGEVEANRTIGNMSIHVALTPGSGSVDLTETTYLVINRNGTYEGYLMQHGENFSIESEFDKDGSIGSSGVLNEVGDRAALNSKPASQYSYQNEGTEVYMRIITPSGATTTYIASVPESLSGKAGQEVLL
jgi:archaellin